MKNIIIWTSFFVALVIVGYFLKVNNVGVWSAVDVNKLVYAQDSRTGVCYAQTSEGITYVPCEKVKHLLP